MNECQAATEPREQGQISSRKRQCFHDASSIVSTLDAWR
jgi:hypothetical protein